MDYEKRRDERREFEADVYYEAWRRNLDPERAVRCADDCYDAGRSAEECVNGYQREVRAARERREYEEYQEQQRYEQYMGQQEDERAE